MSTSPSSLTRHPAAALAAAAPSAREVARPAGPVEVFASSDGGTPVATLPAKTTFGSARALLVTSRTDGWLEVLLPTRPNGATGWIRDAGVPVRSVPFEVRIDLSERSLEVLNAGRQVLRTSVAIGTAEAPTPLGRFFMVDKVDTGSSDSAYGPFALGLSGHSDVLTEFGGGDGQIAVHGTSDPSSKHRQGGVARLRTGPERHRHPNGRPAPPGDAGRGRGMIQSVREGAAADAVLVAAALAGDGQAFASLFDGWFDRCFDVAFRIVRNP